MDDLEEYLHDLLYRICISLVDNEDQLMIEMADTELGRTFHVTPGSNQNYAILVGLKGRTANSIRTIIKNAGMKHQRKFFVEVGGPAQ